VLFRSTANVPVSAASAGLSIVATVFDHTGAQIGSPATAEVLSVPAAGGNTTVSLPLIPLPKATLWSVDDPICTRSAPS
jgi:hypothetical protein